MFQRFRKKPQTKVAKVPTKQTYNVQVVRKVIVGLTALLIVSGGFAFVQANQAKAKVTKMNDTIQILQKKVKEQSIAGLSYSPEIESFMNRFVALYMNANPNNSNDEKRLETLIYEYLATGFKREDIYVPVKRVVDSASFYALKEVDGVATATYKVTYTITQLDKNNQEQEMKATQLLNIPFVIKSNGCRVVAPPYFTSVPLNESKADMISYQTDNYNRIESLSLREEFTNFVKEFFEKYAHNTAQDMSYMMENPEGLENTVTVHNVTTEIFQLKDTKEKVYVAKSLVQFADTGTTVTHNEQMTLYITKKLGKWYVLKLTHTFQDEAFNND